MFKYASQVLALNSEAFRFDFCFEVFLLLGRLINPLFEPHLSSHGMVWCFMCGAWL